MKALSIRQPWAFLIIHGYVEYPYQGTPVKHQKDVENRTWRTNYRGRFLVHASKSVDKEAMRKFSEFLNPDDLVRGGLIGSVELVDVVDNSDSKWFTGPRGFVLKDPKPIDFIPCHGNLNFFTPKVKGLEDL